MIDLSEQGLEGLEKALEHPAVESYAWAAGVGLALISAIHQAWADL